MSVVKDTLILDDSFVLYLILTNNKTDKRFEFSSVSNV